MKKTKVVVVYGESGCGKTTYVKNHIQENDIVYDYDALFSAISFRPEKTTARDCQFQILMDFRRIFLINMQRSGADTAYVIVVDPEKIKKYLPIDAEYVRPRRGEKDGNQTE